MIDLGIERSGLEDRFAIGRGVEHNDFAVHSRSKRGSWLAVDRTSGRIMAQGLIIARIEILMILSSDITVRHE